MKKLLTNNWNLKIASLLLAIAIWVIVINISNPVKDSLTFTGTVEILNGEVIESSGWTYDIPSGITVGFTIKARVGDLKKISPTDIKLTADLKTYWPANGTIGIKYEIVNNANIIESVELKKDTLQVITEEMQTKEFNLVAESVGTPVAGYVVGSIEITPITIKVTAPESIIGQINHVGFEVNTEGAKETEIGKIRPKLYDANGSDLEKLHENFSTKLTFNYPEIEYKVVIFKAHEIALRFNVVGTTAEGYRHTRTESSVSKIAVAGEQAAVALLDYIMITEDTLNVNGATSDVTTTIDLNKYLPAGISIIGLPDSQITVTMKVEKLEQRTMEIRRGAIGLLNKNPDLTYDVGDGSQAAPTFVVEGLKSELDALTEESITGTVDLKDRQAGSYDLVISYVVPENIRVVNVTKLHIIIVGQIDETTEVATTATETTQESESTRESVSDLSETE